MKLFKLDMVEGIVLDAAGETKPWNGWSCPLATVEQVKEFVAKWQNAWGDECPLGDVHEDVDEATGERLLWIEMNGGDEEPTQWVAQAGTADPVLYILDGWTWEPAI